mmetsp:Transcript_120236/g.335450  ORF Transcript_120236/g.335450 Transcript_120236/m.335450 type:complete len:469 (-) Transcript_120236:19-1425(-)
MGERASIALSQVMLLIAGLYISFSASWQLTLFVFVIIPLLVLPTAIQARVVGRASKRSSDAVVETGRLVAESVLNLRTVAAFGLEGNRAARLSVELGVLLRLSVRKGIVLGIGSGASMCAILMGASLEYFVGGIFFVEGLLEFGDIMRVVLVITFIGFGMGQISKDVSDKAEATQAADRVFRLVSSQSKVDPLSTEGIQPESVDGRIELVDVSFAYPSRPEVPIYRGLSLTVEAGQTVALAGPSGCGKSTLVALLERFYDVDGGSVLLDGRDIRTLSVRWLRAQIGLVSQEPVLFAGTVGWNISLGREGATQAEIEAAAAVANAKEIVEALPKGYETEVGERGSSLSGGQKQRIAIARAVVRDPAILVLDEATSALDAQSEKEVQAALDEVVRSKKRTVIIIAHRLSTIREANKICVFSQGALAEEGLHEDLVGKDGGFYQALVRHQSTGRLSRVSSTSALSDRIEGA